MPDIEAIGLPFDEAIEFFRQKTRTPSQTWSEVYGEAHARAFAVAGATSDALLKDFQTAIHKALTQGTTLAEFRKDFDSIVKTHGWQHTGTPGWRAQIIYETNLSTAFAAGRYAQQTQPAVLAAFPYWQYRHSGSRHPRLMHLAWDGLTLKADDPWWDSHYPPNGWHCGCRVSIISQDELRRMGKDGPDTAPPPLTTPWRNPSTGAIHNVPVGIDPGFEHSAGKLWKEGKAAELPVKAEKLRPLAPPEPPAPPEPVKPPAPPKPPAFKPAPPTADQVTREDRRLTVAYRDWGTSLSAEKRAALRECKASGYRTMNAYLRGELRSDSVGAYVDALRRALAEAPPVPKAIRVFRGVPQIVWDRWNAAEVGDILVSPDFVSTSLDAKVAQNFNAGRIVEITIAAGWRGGAYVHPYPEPQHDEREFLLNAGTRFRVIGRRKDGRLRLEAL